MTEPFLKWAGGKRKLLPELRKHIPIMWIADDMTLGSTFTRANYFEPFVGGGAFFFDLRPARAVLSDCNRELIDCYRYVRDDVEGVIGYLRRFLDMQAAGDVEANYYFIRDELPPGGEASSAARMIYLNRTCFNGLYRVNRAGQFNVPWGKRAFDFDPMRLRECSHALKRTWLYAQDFEHTIEGAQEGDLVYCDPPYVGTFNAYAARGFGEAEQLRLRDALLRAKQRGVHIIASNSVAAEPLYADGFDVHYVHAKRSIAADGTKRADAKEIIIT